LGALKAILEDKVEARMSPEEIRLEDQADYSAHLDPHAEEPEFSDTHKV
jgi:hypothetical protein